MKSILHKTLEEIENDYWPPPAETSSNLIRDCHAARKKKLQDLEPSDVRLLISQDIGLPHIVLLALKWLDEDILTEAIYYPGDLLLAVLRAPSLFWKENKKLWEQVNTLYKNFEIDITQSTEIEGKIKRDILKEYKAFSEIG